MNNYLIFDSKLIQCKMKHLISIFTALFFIINIANAQTVNSEIRIIGGKKYLIYNIKAGETWASIAEKSGITERSLIDANEQANGSLKNVATLKVGDNNRIRYSMVGLLPVPPATKLPTPMVGIVYFLEDKKSKSYSLFLHHTTK